MRYGQSGRPVERREEEEEIVVLVVPAVEGGVSMGARSDSEAGKFVAVRWTGWPETSQR